MTLTFRGGRCEVRRGEKLIRRGTHSTDPTRSPKTITVCFIESDVPELIGAPLQGIYEANAEKLRICYGPPAGTESTHSQPQSEPASIWGNIGEGMPQNKQPLHRPGTHQGA